VNLALGVSWSVHSEVFTSVTTLEAPVNTDYDGRQVVGIDLHRRRSVIVQQTQTGDRVG
jgi:hypothetical protein